MKIFIIGAGGVASALCKCFEKDKKVVAVTCASNNIKKAKEFIQTRGRKIKLLKSNIDASNTNQLAKAIMGFDLVINASLPNFNQQVMKAALQSKVNYQDLCSWLPDFKSAEQLRFHEKFRKAGLIGLINTGVSPGITNVLAAEGKDKFEEIEEIKIRGIEEQKAHQLIFAWSPAITLRELNCPAPVFRNKKTFFVEPLSDGEIYQFPEPIGKKYVVSVQGDEVSTLPLYINVKKVDYKVCGTDIDFGEALSRLGLLSGRSIRIYDKKVKPVDVFLKLAPPVPSPKEMQKLIRTGIIENAFYLAVIDIIGKQGGKKMRMRNVVVYPDLNEIAKRMPGATYISYPTAVAVASFAKIIPQIKMRGVFPPEALTSKIRRDILIDLEGYGITVQQEFSRL